MRRKQQALTAAGAGEEDRISALPDEIIHHTLSRVRSSKQAARSSALSKRWAALWRSYPILEYHGDFSQWRPSRSLEKFVTAASKKLSDDTLTIEAIRIRFDQNAPTNLVNALFASSAKKLSPQEIDIAAAFYMHWPLYKNSRLLKLATVSSLISRRLRTLKLHGFEIDGFEAAEVLFSCLESIRVIHLSYIRVVNDDADDERGGGGFVNRMVSAARGLEELSLSKVGARHLRVCDHPKLRRLELCPCWNKKSVELTGLVSLETLIVSDYSTKLKLKSPMPKLKTLKVRVGSESTRRLLRNLTQYCPSLDSLELSGISSEVELKIRSLSLRRLKLCHDYDWRVPRLKMVELDAPRLNHVICNGLGLDRLSAIDWVANCVAADAVFVLELSVHLNVMTLDNFRVLRMMFAQLNRQFQVVLHIPYFTTNKVLLKWSRAEEGQSSPAPVIDHVEFTCDQTISDHHKNKFLNGLFWCCRPKYLVDRYHPAGKCLLFLKDLCMMSSTKKYNRTLEYCWRWLKDVKIVKKGRFDHREKGLVEVVEVDVSELKYTNTTKVHQNRICYKLIWQD